MYLTFSKFVYTQYLLLDRVFILNLPAGSFVHVAASF